MGMPIIPVLALIDKRMKQIYKSAGGTYRRQYGVSAYIEALENKLEDYIIEVTDRVYGIWFLLVGDGLVHKVNVCSLQRNTSQR